MKKFEQPVVQVEELEIADVITASNPCATETDEF